VTRLISPEDFHSVDAVNHLSALSNDPPGELNQDIGFKSIYIAFF
jgi:hypothetical protein